MRIFVSDNRNENGFGKLIIKEFYLNDFDLIYLFYCSWQHVICILLYLYCIVLILNFKTTKLLGLLN